MVTGKERASGRARLRRGSPARHLVASARAGNPGVRRGPDVQTGPPVALGLLRTQAELRPLCLGEGDPLDPSPMLAPPAPSLRPACLFPRLPLGRPGAGCGPLHLLRAFGQLRAPRHGTPSFPPSFECVSDLGRRYYGGQAAIVHWVVSFQDLFGRVVTSLAAGGRGEPRSWLGAAAALGGARWRSAAAGLAGLAGLGPARGTVRQSVGERGGGGFGGEGRGEGRPLPYMAQAPPPDVTL